MLRKFATVPLLLVVLAAGRLFAQAPEPRATDWEEINFEYNSSKLVDGFPSLLRLAELLQKNAPYKVTLEGHADTIGTTGYNQKLGLDRAGAVRDFLIKYGARAGQITTTSQGKANPKYPGQKPTFSPTDEARWMNRRVAITVMDAQGKSVGDGSTGDAIRAIQNSGAGTVADCCSEVLKRLDKLDEIQRLLKDLADQNAALRRDLGELKNGQDALKTAQDALKQGQQVLESKVNTPGPVGPAGANGAGGAAGAGAARTGADTGAARTSPFQLLGVNIGADDTGNTTFSGKGRFFAPIGHGAAFQAQGEYLYFKTQREGQIDFGLVQRMRNVQAGLFASFKHVTLAGNQSGGTLGQAALTIDYIFKNGKIGFFGTKGFMDNAVVNRALAVSDTGVLLPNITIEKYLKIVDQAGISGTVGLWKNNYFEGNIGYLHSALGNRAGGTGRLIFPLNDKIAITVEGGVNETAQIVGGSGRAVAGLQFGNVIRPKEMQAADHPIPVDVPRVRYDVLTRRIRTGNSPPVADAGPNQIGVPAGTITLDGSASYDPDGDPITYQWVQEAGPVATLSAPTSAKTTYTATAGQNYSFRLTVKDTLGAQSSARVLVQTKANDPVQIVFFTGTPTQINPGQASTLAWRVLNADNISISGVGTVQAVASASVTPNQTTTYVLTASNAVNTATASVTIVVGGGNTGTKVLFCYATPTNITVGESATLNYSTQNADTVTITPGVGAVAKSGSVTVSPTQTTVYTVTATGGGGTATDTCSVAVQVTAGALPRIIQFSANPGHIDSGQASTLLWLVENATTVSISTIGNVGLAGTQDVLPAQTTTYTITATNKIGSVTANAIVTVNVIPAPKITSFTATPPVSPSPGSPVVLACTATDATSIVMNGILFIPGTATSKVFPLVDTTYTCTATGQKGQTDTQTLTVKVTPIPPPPPPGTPPTIVIAGGNTLTITDRKFSIDASGSFSPGGNNPLTYAWSASNTNPAAILNPTSSITNVQLSGPSGTYIFYLTVTDSKGNSSTATITVLFPVDHVQ